MSPKGRKASIYLQKCQTVGFVLLLWHNKERAMETIKDTIETRKSGASISEDLGQSALNGAENGNHQIDSETITNEISAGSLVKLKLVEQEHEVFVYISELERSVFQLPDSVREQLPEKVMVNPLVVEKSSDDKKVSANLAERLEHKTIGDTIELVNHKHAEILEITQLTT